MQPLNLPNRIDRPGFMIACDTVYFQNWAKTLFFSMQEHAPWAHVHFHIFDPVDQDHKWLQRNNCTYSTETTPVKYQIDKLTSVLYWAAARYMRVREIYTDNTVLINQDADSIMVKDLSYDDFMSTMDRSWVPTAPKREQLSLASALGFGPDNMRHILPDRYNTVIGTPEWIWAYDQRVLDKMIDAGEIGTMDLRYTDFKFTDLSYIWTGKGDRVYKKTFVEKMNKYRHLL